MGVIELALFAASEISAAMGAIIVSAHFSLELDASPAKRTFHYLLSS